MSYVVLARRYRPARFSELIGQEHVSVTLKNAVKSERTAHAYLFTGPRGVGKTSAARILAKAIRCLKPESDGEPCNKCEACVGVDNGSSLDVIEIDAASNTGVDNIRDLRDNVGYVASIGKYRVYIIDEVHMLSTAAFNALLKTLEEPPPHIVFIFATTEIHKVLPTILSRCQRFDFKRIRPEAMNVCLQDICQKEGVSIDAASLRTIITESEGCMRDAESLLDQAIAFCGKKIDIGNLERALGLLDRNSLVQLLRAIGKHAPGEALKLTSSMFDKGMDAKILLNRLVEFFRELHYRLFTGENPSQDPDFDPVFEELKKNLSQEEIIRAFDLCLRTQGQLLSSTDATYTVESLVARLSLQATAIAQTNVVSNVQSSSPTMTARPAPAQSSAPQTTNHTAMPAQKTPPQIQTTAAATGDFSLATLEQYIKRSKPAWTPVLASILELQGDATIVKVRAKNDFAGKRLASNDGVEVLKTAYGVPKAVITIEAAAAATPNSVPKDNRTQEILEKRRLSREHDAVQSAMSIFDAKIIETKTLEDKE